MNRIEQEEYGRVRDIFAELAEMHLNVIAVLDGNCPGTIYVDDVHQPRTAYLISGDGHYLAGSAENRSFNVALNAALPRDHYFVLFCTSESWEGAMDVILNGTYAIRSSRCYYTLAHHKVPSYHLRVPEGFSMQPIGRALLERGLGNTDSVLAGILDCWHSVDGFLQQGFGFCLVYESSIASWSLADYVHGDVCEIGINTDGGYRRQGLGTLTAAANAEYAVGLGYATIGWHCWQNNTGSIRVAENVGFRKAADYEVFINHWAAENITDMSRDEFQAFAELYERQFEAQPPSSGFPHIVTAKAWALSGDRSGCFRHLNKAVDLGWLSGADHLREIWPEFFWNPDREKMPEWQDLVRRFERAE